VLAFLACGIIGAGASAGHAQFREGTVEAGLLLGGGARAGDDRHQAQYLLLRVLGYSVTDRWQIGFGIGLAGDFHSVPSTALQGQAQFYLAPAATIVPYAGVHAGLEAAVLTDPRGIREVLGPQLGAKWRAGEELLLIAEVRYSLHVSQPDQGAVLLSVGFSLLDDPKQAATAAEVPR
jgi:hypothetical protein